MAKAKASRTVKAWHIVNYDELFRAKDTGGRLIATVKYAQDIMAAADEFSAQHMLRMDVLEAELGFEAFVTAKHLFMQLLKHSHKYSGELTGFRGYILDECLRSPGPAKIGLLTRCPAPVVRKFLPVLARVGLIERRTVPTRTSGPTPDPTPPSTQKTTRKKTASKTKKTTKKAAGGGKNATKTAAQTSCGSPATSFKKGKCQDQDQPQPSASGKAQEENKSESEAPIEAQHQGQAHRPAAAAPPRAGQGQGEPEPEPEEQAGRQGQANRKAGSTIPKGNQTPASPAAAPLSLNLMDLTETDGGGAGLPTADRPASSDINLTERLERLYDRSGYGFAEEVYRQIGVPHATDTTTGRSEIEAFAAAWQRALKAGLGPAALVELRAKAIKRATYFGRQRERGKRYRNGPEAVWMYEFNKRLNAMRMAEPPPVQDVKSC